MSDPTPTPNGVWVPLPFYMALLDCYYGVGPSHPKARTYTPPPPPDPGEPPPSPDPMKIGVPISTSRHWVPKGVNSRPPTTMVTDDQQRAQPRPVPQPSDAGRGRADGVGPPTT